MKFKVGDKVEITGNTSRTGGSRYHIFNVGSRGVIITVGYGGYGYEVRENKNHETQGIYEKDMKLITPRIKDLWVELKTDLKEKYSFSENDIEEVVDLLKLKKSIADLKTRELTCEEV